MFDRVLNTPADRSHSVSLIDSCEFEKAFYHHRENDEHILDPCSFNLLMYFYGHKIVIAKMLFQRHKKDAIFKKTHISHIHSFFGIYFCS